MEHEDAREPVYLIGFRVAVPQPESRAGHEQVNKFAFEALKLAPSGFQFDRDL
jgi:hypothetical protein